MRAWEIFTPADVSRFTPMVARNAAKPARRGDLVQCARLRARVSGHSACVPADLHCSTPSPLSSAA